MNFGHNTYSASSPLAGALARLMHAQLCLLIVITAHYRPIGRTGFILDRNQELESVFVLFSFYVCVIKVLWLLSEHPLVAKMNHAPPRDYVIIAILTKWPRKTPVWLRHCQVE